MEHLLLKSGCCTHTQCDLSMRWTARKLALACRSIFRKQACVLFKYAFIPFPLRVQSHKLLWPFQVPPRRCVRPRSCLHRPAPALSLLCHCVLSQPADNARAPGANVAPAFLYGPGCSDQTHKLEASMTPAASQHPTRTQCNQATLLPGRAVQDLTVIAH